MFVQLICSKVTYFYIVNLNCLVNVLVRDRLAPISNVPGGRSYRHSDAQVNLGLECVGNIGQNLEIPYIVVIEFVFIGVVVGLKSLGPFYCILLIVMIIQHNHLWIIQLLFIILTSHISREWGCHVPSGWFALFVPAK